eukprot:TRINITY_DN410_c0_g1_i1.p1 TRINITY_DN410_c0_g1~~TRINITY_DN410_c0_g1_i1.p1  ORF type:complete len:139 (-),score=16.90 TRINITY_DN410_c0_g1_i1:59-475(-)
MKRQQGPIPGARSKSVPWIPFFEVQQQQPQKRTRWSYDNGIHFRPLAPDSEVYRLDAILNQERKVAAMKQKEKRKMFKEKIAELENLLKPAESRGQVWSASKVISIANKELENLENDIKVLSKLNDDLHEQCVHIHQV